VGAVPIAVGTDFFEIVFSGGIGSLLSPEPGAVDLSIVAPLLAGSALGARLCSAATGRLDEPGIEIYVGLMVLGGAVAVAIQEAGKTDAFPAAREPSLALIVPRHSRSPALSS